MTTRTYGFAAPLKFDDVKPGMLISAATGSGRHVLGLAFQGDREVLLAVFQQAAGGTETPVPYVIQLGDVLNTLTQIRGDLEFEPADGAPNFALLPNRRSGFEGLVVTADGTVGLAVQQSRFGHDRYLMLDFDTGEDLKHGGIVAAIPSYKMYVKQMGSEQRREIVLKPFGG